MDGTMVAGGLVTLSPKYPESNSVGAGVTDNDAVMNIDGSDGTVLTNGPGAVEDDTGTTDADGVRPSTEPVPSSG